ncbi:uncharacterized protein LOC113333613 [Papaver somniferum]|uniref:uncharacterized protein LOC113333613 n=1 Tax=Papaver somniferum TaxID=3469 RepID=UPI000E6F7087|nr:uncharacterized protein LOC113333613 [Papaver somniferum]
MILIYVDDILITGNSSTYCSELFSLLQTHFPLKDLGDLHNFLGLEVKRYASSIFLSQTKYALDLLNKHDMLGAKPCSSPVCVGTKFSATDGVPLSDPTSYRSMVGALKYLTWNRPEICYAVNQVCQFMQSPISEHLTAAKRILRYIKSTVDYGILFNKGLLAVHGFSDADWDGSPDTRRST